MNTIYPYQKNPKINMDELIEDYNLDFGMFSNLDDRLLEMEDS